MSDASSARPILPSRHARTHMRQARGRSVEQGPTPGAHPRRQMLRRGPEPRRRPRYRKKSALPPGTRSDSARSAYLKRAIESACYDPSMTREDSSRSPGIGSKFTWTTVRSRRIAASFSPGDGVTFSFVNGHPEADDALPSSRGDRLLVSAMKRIVALQDPDWLVDANRAATVVAARAEVLRAAERDD